MAKSKTQTGTPATAAPAAKPNIKAMSPMDALKALAAKTPQKPAAASKKARPTLTLTPEGQEALATWAGYKKVFEPIKTRLENAAAELNAAAIAEFSNVMFAGKCQPQNPALQTTHNGVDIESMFLVTAKFTPNNVQPKSEADAIAALVAAGMSHANAEKLVQTELSYTPKTGLKNFKELIEGRKQGDGFVPATAAQQAVAQKLLDFVMNQLTDAERDLVVDNIPDVRVNDGFLDRLASYCDNADQVRAVLTLIKPVYYPKGAKFGTNLTPDQKRDELLKVLATVVDSLAGDE